MPEGPGRIPQPNGKRFNAPNLGFGGAGSGVRRPEQTLSQQYKTK